MKKPQVKKIFFSGLILISALAQAQTDMKDLEKISKSYSEMVSYQFDLKYTVFNDYKTHVEADAYTMSIAADGNEYYSKRKDNEVLINKRYMLVVDHEDKTLMIDEYKKASTKKGEIVAELGIDSVLQQISTQVKKVDPIVEVEQKNINEQEKQYIFNYSSGEYTTLKINYNASSFMINKIILYFREENEMEEGQPETTPRIEISYLHTDLHPQFGREVFSEKKYAQVKKDGRLELSAELKNYKVINYLLK